ncbi:MAG: protein-glutamate O-methyltransferase CheR [Planctomycetota bacterium]
MTQVTAQGIDAVCELVSELSGIVWDDSKTYLIEARLKSLADEHGCACYSELVRKVRSSQIPKDVILDAVTTNETLWFRDNAPFEALKHKALPEIIDAKLAAGKKRLRIWSAASSSGQEPYSIAMTIAETLPDFRQWDIQILGTDISLSILKEAKAAEYGELEISRGMSDHYLRKYMVKKQECWTVSDDIRLMCSFRTRNLLETFMGLGPFDIIFCRNVAIYFSREDRNSLFTRMRDIVTDDGWLFTGSSETLTELRNSWDSQQHCGTTCYRPKAAVTV